MPVEEHFHEKFLWKELRLLPIYVKSLFLSIQKSEKKFFSKK